MGRKWRFPKEPLVSYARAKTRRRSCRKCGVSVYELQQRRRAQNLPRASWSSFLKPAPRKPRTRYCPDCLAPIVQAHIADRLAVGREREAAARRRFEEARSRQFDMTPRRTSSPLRYSW